MDLTEYSHAQRQRLAFIDFCLQYFGQIARSDLIKHFNTGLASGTRDFTLYKELAPENLELLHQTKLYYRTNKFQPVFNHEPDAILTSLCRGFGDGIASIYQPSEVCFDAIRLVQPKSEIIAALMRAIQNQQAVLCQYVSLSSGMSERELVPHSIVNNGHRWHVRAFDRRSYSFRDFVCTRFLSVKTLAGRLNSIESRSEDKAWADILPLELIPHPKLSYPLAVELDYAMSEGRLVLEVRAALVGYLLQQWHVDCSAQHNLNANKYPLALNNIYILKNHSNALLAPGYQTPTPRQEGDN